MADDAKVIGDAEFSRRLDKLRAELPLAEMMMKHLGSLANFPEHLRKDALTKMGVKEHVNAETGFVCYEDVSEHLGERKEGGRG